MAKSDRNNLCCFSDCHIIILCPWTSISVNRDLPPRIPLFLNHISFQVVKTSLVNKLSIYFLLLLVDLNRRPSAPRNVAFAIVSPNSDRNSFFVQATWEMYSCQSNFSCIELLGYVISCRAENSVEDMTLTIWLSDIEDSDTSDFLLPVKPFTRYTCSMASMNTYGVGLPGSRISVDTPETSKQSISYVMIILYYYLFRLSLVLNPLEKRLPPFFFSFTSPYSFPSQHTTLPRYHIT